MSAPMTATPICIACGERPVAGRAHDLCEQCAAQPATTSTATPKPPREITRVFDKLGRLVGLDDAKASEADFRYPQYAPHIEYRYILAPSPEAGGELAQELERDLRVVSEIMVGDRPRNTPEGYDAWERVKAAVRASVAPESNAPAAAAFDKMFAGTTPADIPALRSQAPSADAGVREALAQELESVRASHKWCVDLARTVIVTEDGRAIEWYVRNLVDELQKAWQEIEALRSSPSEQQDARDAGRYRLIRRVSLPEWERLGHYIEEALDEQIDAAIAASGGAKGGWEWLTNY